MKHTVLLMIAAILLSWMPALAQLQPIASPVSGIYTFNATSVDLPDPNDPGSLVCGVAYVQYQIDGIPSGTPAVESPGGSHLYPYTWDSRTAPDGPHTVSATAYDRSGKPLAVCDNTNPNSATSVVVSFTVKNTPDVCIATPLVVTGLKWPSSRTGNRSLTWNSATFPILSIQYSWPYGGIRTAVFTDDRGCKTTRTP